MGWRDSTRWLLGRHLRALILLTNTGCLPCDRHGAGLWEHSSGQSHTCSCRFCRWWDSQTQSDNLSFMMYSRSFFSSQFYKREDWDSGHTLVRNIFLYSLSLEGSSKGEKWVGGWAQPASGTLVGPLIIQNSLGWKRLRSKVAEGLFQYLQEIHPFLYSAAQQWHPDPRNIYKPEGPWSCGHGRSWGEGETPQGLSSGEVLFYLILISGGSSAFRIQPPAPVSQPLN